MTGQDQRRQHHMASDLRPAIIRRVVQILILVALQSAVLFLSSADPAWVWAWVYVGLYLAAIGVNAMLLGRSSPETIAERSMSGENMAGWDKVVGGLFALVFFVVLLCVAGLDERWGWSGPLPLWCHLVGIALFILGSALFSWGMVSNAFFATVARIQDERGHAVCDTGPYAVIRHPGYLGATFQALALPLLLGSWWATIPATISVLLLVIRTALEDKMLHDELVGYAVYARRVRYRLIPGIW